MRLLTSRNLQFFTKVSEIPASSPTGGWSESGRERHWRSWSTPGAEGDTPPPQGEPPFKIVYLQLMTFITYFIMHYLHYKVY